MPSSPIHKKELHHLSKLARIELTDREEEKLLKDLQTIVGHFEELQELRTDTTVPMTGGTNLTNKFREDDATIILGHQTGKDAFPEEKGGLLKVPGVFTSDEKPS